MWSNSFEHAKVQKEIIVIENVKDLGIFMEVEYCTKENIDIDKSNIIHINYLQFKDLGWVECTIEYVRKYFDVPEEDLIYLWDFKQTGTFNLIRKENRQKSIKKHLDNFEYVIGTLFT